jgi:hypothetical protein
MTDKTLLTLPTAGSQSSGAIEETDDLSTPGRLAETGPDGLPQGSGLVREAPLGSHGQVGR